MQHKALSYGWNACIEDFRAMDLLNNREAAMLRFEELAGLSKQQQDDLKELELPSMLPARCFVAGVLKEVVEAGKFSPHHTWVTSLSWGWCLWVLKQSGLISQQQVRGCRVWSVKLREGANGIGGLVWWLRTGRACQGRVVDRESMGG
jgi:hypothetical protein